MSYILIWMNNSLSGPYIYLQNKRINEMKLISLLRITNKNNTNGKIKVAPPLPPLNELTNT